MNRRPNLFSIKTHTTKINPENLYIFNKYIYLFLLKFIHLFLRKNLFLRKTHSTKINQGNLFISRKYIYLFLRKLIVFLRKNLFLRKPTQPK